MSQDKSTQPPVWIRLNEAAKIVGLCRSRFYELLKEAAGGIKTISLKSPGTERGARLVHLPSLLAYFNKLAAAEQAK